MKIIDYDVVNIRAFINGQYKDLTTKDYLNDILSDFNCPKNSDVENFLKNNALDFAQKQLSVTYLVFSGTDAALLGYFTIAIKPILVRVANFNYKTKRVIKQVSKYDEEQNAYLLSAYLIAQLARNFKYSKDIFSGDELLDLAMEQIYGMQYAVGGKIVFIETENNSRLLDFYKANNFAEFDTRLSKQKTGQSKELIQMLRVL